jgi:hypothetical protein
MTVTYQFGLDELDASLIRKIKSQFGKCLAPLQVTLAISEIDETERILNNPILAEKILKRRQSAVDGKVINFTPEAFHEIVAKHSI